MKHNIFPFLLALAALPVQAQRIASTTEVIDCGQVLYRQPVSVTFNMVNTGSQVLHIDDVRTGCGCATATYPKGSIGADEKFDITTTYRADRLGHFERQLLVYSNGSRQPFMLTLRGVVVSEPSSFTGTYACVLGKVKADRATVEFDDVNRGDRPTAEINILNPTSHAVQPVVMHLPPYLKADVSPSAIAPDRAGVVRLTLLSDRLRDYGLTQTIVYLGSSPGEKVNEDKAVEVSAVLLPKFAQMTEAQMAEQPRLTMTADVLDLGSLGGKKRKRGDITLTNSGRSDLVISSVQMFTSGMQVSLSSTRLKPGESARLRITAEKRMLRQKTRPRVLMITNDPRMPKVTVDVKLKY